MRYTWAAVVVMFGALMVSCGSEPKGGGDAKLNDAPRVTMRPAPRLAFPWGADSNSPAFWAEGQLHVFNSTGHPYHSVGKGLFELGQAKAISYDNKVNGGRWIEAVWRNGDGVVYGWYHIEPAGLVPGTTLTAPKIGALRSEDNGATWKDLGIILEAREGTLKPEAKNGYFAGGHGDFCVYLDQDEKWLYIYFGNYAGDVSEQGVGVARMRWRDRERPVGKVHKWHEGEWQEPGVGGRLTPIWPAFVAWERADCNAFWGPSIHWNMQLKQYVMLLNRSKAQGWVQEGVYVSFAKDVGNPKGWSQPRKIVEGGAWYPQVMGLEAGGTDKLAGGVARFFMAGVSEQEIVFEK